MQGSICFKHSGFELDICEQFSLTFCLSKHVTGSNNRALEHVILSI